MYQAETPSYRLHAINGKSLLTLQSSHGEVEVRLPRALTVVLLCLFEHHQGQSEDRRKLDALGSKALRELASERGLAVRSHYGIGKYVAKIRQLIAEATEDAGISGAFRDVITSRNGWGYAIRPDADVGLVVEPEEASHV